MHAHAGDGAGAPTIAAKRWAKQAHDAPMED
jgi:hypothetical protein